MSNVIVPEAGKAREVAQLLLELAEHPRDVRTSSDGPVAVTFVVTDEVYALYEQAFSPEVEEEDEQGQVTPSPSDEGVTQPKRRGRPPGTRNKVKSTEDAEE